MRLEIGIGKLNYAQTIGSQTTSLNSLISFIISHPISDHYSP